MNLNFKPLTVVTSMVNGVINWSGTWLVTGEMNSDDAKAMNKIIDYKPIKVIYNDPFTIAFFSDGTKITSRCADGETFYPENGLMACIVKKMYGSRSAFMKVVESGYDQKTAKELEDINIFYNPSSYFKGNGKKKSK
jgi:hypothetical protein